MEKHLDDLQQRLHSTINNLWCRTLGNEINRLSSSLSNKLPLYRTGLTREQLMTSIKLIQDLNITSTHNDLYYSSLKNYLLFLSIHTHKLVCEILLGHVYHLKQHLHYWKHDEPSRLAIIDQIKTTFWFDQDRDDIRSTEKVKFLNQQEQFLSNIIGRLAYTITSLEQQEEISLDSVMNYTNELYKLLFDNASVDYNSHSDLVDVIEVYSQMLNSFDEFKSRWANLMHLYNRPTHIKRYLPYYVCATSIGLYTVYKVYTNREQIINYIYTSYDSLTFFVNEHLIAPLKTIYKSTFESRASQTAFENSQLNYINSKKILEEMLEEYGREHAGTLSQVNNASLQEFLSTLNERARNEDMNIVMKNYQLEMNQPIRSALLGDLIKGILIQVQKVKVDGEGLVIQIDQLMKQNEINFSLLATIPAILLITFLIISTKNVISNFLIKQRKFDISTLRLRIIRKMREIEHVLIFNIETPALTMNNNEIIVTEKEHNENHNHLEVMTNLTYGRFLSLVYELKYFTNQIKSQRMLSNEFNEDINLLTHTQLSVQQKILIIQQICHSYSFLVHS
ncbi:unnamed protein product [Rotaria socialis]|uniref:Nuclear control of ATPase protein 2 n=1 Tax=Rotaria socialis TaxID=392032 RepID=A0A820QJ68_9BILA|nr:unnamed protein product [Rotaria socialis]CAF3314078.1 unnamed protein product [Rotaria socialis]CAF3336586.1 unnamed protein product [Rotaria socialis]CAF3439129.1 unnamed protein product [Rotaria socialis]CAF4267830.1 unnamed protein product [Rotaria socialis]